MLKEALPEYNYGEFAGDICRACLQIIESEDLERLSAQIASVTGEMVVLDVFAGSPEHGDRFGNEDK